MAGLLLAGSPSLSHAEATADIILSVTPESISESAGLTRITVTATLSEGSADEEIEVAVRVGLGSSSATARVDYEENPVGFTITIPDEGSAGSRFFSITPIDDSIYEGSEHLAITGSATGFTVAGTSLELTDNDSAPVLTLSVDPARISEAAGSATLTVEITSGSPFTSDQSIAFSTSGTAVLGTDYAIDPSPLTLPASSESASATLTARDDELTEGDLTVLIQAMLDGNPIGEEQSVTILDDEASEEAPELDLDLNEDGMVDEQDAAVLYYAYLRAALLYPDRGGRALFRSAFLSRLVSRENRNDTFYLQMLERAAALQEGT